MNDESLNDYYLFLKRQNLFPKTIKQLINNTHLLLSECSPWTEKSLNNFIIKKLDEVSAASVNKYLQAAKKYNQFKKIRFSKKCYKKLEEVPKEKPTFSDDEIDRFLSLPDVPKRSDRGGYAKMTIFWTIIAWTGARRNEIRWLDVNCVDFATGSFVFPRTKTGRGRVVLMHPLIRPKVKEYVDNLTTKLLFASYRDPSKPFSEAAYLKDFNDRIGRLGIIKDVDPGSFRHSLATGTLNNGAGLLHVQDILGHKDPKTTRLYMRGNLKAQEEALNKYLFVENKLGAKTLIRKVDEFISNLHFENIEGVNFETILEVRKLLWRSLEVAE